MSQKRRCAQCDREFEHRDLHTLYHSNLRGQCPGCGTQLLDDAESELRWSQATTEPVGGSLGSGATTILREVVRLVVWVPILLIVLYGGAYLLSEDGDFALSITILIAEYLLYVGIIAGALGFGIGILHEILERAVNRAFATVALGLVAAIAAWVMTNDPLTSIGAAVGVLSWIEAGLAE